MLYQLSYARLTRGPRCYSSFFPSVKAPGTTSSFTPFPEDQLPTLTETPSYRIIATYRLYTMKNRLSTEALNEAAECLAVLAHPSRLRLVELLLEERHTVGELAQACANPPNVTSEHLRLMQRCGFLTSTRSGRFVYYTVQEPHLLEILNCIRKRFAKKGINDARDRAHRAS